MPSFARVMRRNKFRRDSRNRSRVVSRVSTNRSAEPAPARAAMIGPAAMNGPRPGIASAPMPASHPRVPPTTAPEPAPVAAPSGASCPSRPRSLSCQRIQETARRYPCSEILLSSMHRPRARRPIGSDRCQRPPCFSSHYLPAFVLDDLAAGAGAAAAPVVVTVSSFITLPTPATAVALASISFFSSSERTGPRSVTLRNPVGRRRRGYKRRWETNTERG